MTDLGRAREPHADEALSLSLPWAGEELVAKTEKVWSKVYGRAITRDEAIEILINVKRFAEVMQAARAEMSSQAEKPPPTRTEALDWQI